MNVENGVLGCMLLRSCGIGHPQRRFFTGILSNYLPVLRDDVTVVVSTRPRGTHLLLQNFNNCARHARSQTTDITDHLHHHEGSTVSRHKTR